MIRSFKSKETAKIFSRQKAALFPEEIQRLALRQLRLLDQTLVAKEDWIRARHNGFNGNSTGTHARYSIALDPQWRICFEWREGHAYEVDLVEASDAC